MDVGKPYESGSHWEENALDGNKCLLELYVVLCVVQIIKYCVVLILYVVQIIKYYVVTNRSYQKNNVDQVLMTRTKSNSSQIQKHQINLKV